MDPHERRHIRLHLTFNEHDKLFVAGERSISGDTKIASLRGKVSRRDPFDSDNSGHGRTVDRFIYGKIFHDSETEFVPGVPIDSLGDYSATSNETDPVFEPKLLHGADPSLGEETIKLLGILLLFLIVLLLLLFVSEYRSISRAEDPREDPA